MNYKPALNSNIKTEAIDQAYEKLSPEDKLIIDKCTARIRLYMTDKFGREHNVATEKSLRELLGKIGIWMIERKKENKNERKNRNKIDDGD